MGYDMYVIAPHHNDDLDSIDCPLINPKLYKDIWYGDDNSISEIFEAEIQYFCNGEEDEQYCAAFCAGKGDNESIYFLDEFIRIDHAKNF